MIDSSPRRARIDRANLSHLRADSDPERSGLRRSCCRCELGLSELLFRLDGRNCGLDDFEGVSRLLGPGSA